MPDETDSVTTAIAPLVSQDVDSRATYRADVGVAPAPPQTVGSIHVAAVGTGLTYTTGCGCCPLGCNLTTCAQCSNGYGPKTFNFQWTHSNPPDPPTTVGVVWWSNGAKIRNFFATPTITATGDCVWEGYFGTNGFEYGSSWYIGYFKLFYDGAWKCLFDYAPLGFPSGNGVTFTLDSDPDCSLQYQEIAITQSDGPPPPLTLLTTWDILGTPVGDAIPRTIRLYSCGNATSATNCCTERVPFRMTISFVGCPAVATATVNLDHSGSGAWSSNYAVADPVALALYYSFQLTCEKYPTAGDPYTWVLRVYDLTTGGTLVYTGAATSSTCYPIHLTFASAGLHFPNYGGGDLCNGVAFTMHVTV